MVIYDNLSEAFLLTAPHNQFIDRVRRIQSVPDWMTGNDDDKVTTDNRRNITVRFTNTVSGKDVVVQAPEGENLLYVGDNAGVKLPRACRTGLCGSCTCEVQDPSALSTSSSYKDGYATIRACSVNTFVPAGMNEMVVDVSRMRKQKKQSTDTVIEESDSSFESDYVSSNA